MNSYTRLYLYLLPFSGKLIEIHRNECCEGVISREWGQIQMTKSNYAEEVQRNQKIDKITRKIT